MEFPNEKSTIEEIESFQPQTMFGNWYWFRRKQELLKIKKNNLERFF